MNLYTVVNGGGLLYKKEVIYDEALNYFDFDQKKFTLTNEKRCELNSKYDRCCRKTKSQRKLFKDLSFDYKDFEFIKPYSVTIKNPQDGTQIPVNVWPAKGADTANPKPLIIYVHGGPDIYVDITDLDYYAERQYLASQGYWVVCPETRGSAGYGGEHTKALVNNWGQNHIDDIITVARAFKTQPDVDHNKVFLMGDSFGGYATLAAATKPDVADYFDGYVSICGVGDVGKAISEGSEFSLKKQDYLDDWNDRVGFISYKNNSTNPRDFK